MPKIKLSRVEQARYNGHVLRQVLDELSRACRPGISGKDLERMADAALLKHGVRGAFKNYQNYPSNLCVSLNDAIVHGLPNERPFKSGDLVKIDLGVKQGDVCSDAAVTVGLESLSETAQRLCSVTRTALELAIRVIKPGIRTGLISHTIQSVVESAGFAVSRELTGHGIGARVHEPPSIPCFGKPDEGTPIEEGMLLAVEVMSTEHATKLETDRDGFTLRTADHGLSAHFEHTVLVTNDGVEILTQLT